MARHTLLLLLMAVAAFVGLSVMMSFDGPTNVIPQHITPPQAQANAPAGEKMDVGAIPTNLLTGDVLAPKLENATLKAELGRASWKLFHTMMARFPEKPTEDDSLALKSYIHLFARLYPCGDCARHFQQLLTKYPPQVSGRNAAAGWACFVHNEVNTRLKKELFNCNNIGDFYDCGCGDEKKKEGGEAELKQGKE